jgi:hypothetical protein
LFNLLKPIRAKAICCLSSLTISNVIKWPIFVQVYRLISGDSVTPARAGLCRRWIEGTKLGYPLDPWLSVTFSRINKPSGIHLFLWTKRVKRIHWLFLIKIAHIKQSLTSHHPNMAAPDNSRLMEFVILIRKQICS